MTAAHHDLALDFPEYRDRLAHMEASSSEFARIFGEYRDVSTELHRIEAKLETPTHAYVEALQKRRLHLKDEIHRVLAAS